MVSPARKLFLQKAAAEAAARAVDTSLDHLLADASPYEILRAALGQCLDELRNIQSIEAKIERKRTMLPDFEPWCDGVLSAAGADGFVATPDDILVQALVWQIDVGNFAKALPLAAHVIRHGLALPERFKRTAATMIADESAEAALKALGQGGAFELATLQAVDELTSREDMPDQARAKLKKAIGLELQRQADAIPDTETSLKRAAIAAALEVLRRALELMPRVGVKKEVERLEAAARRLEAQAKE